MGCLRNTDIRIKRTGGAAKQISVLRRLLKKITGKGVMTLKKQRRLLYIFFLPMALVLLVFVAYPFMENLRYSFLDYKLTKIAKPFVLLDNYVKIFKSSDFMGLLSKTLVWTIGNMVLVLLLGISTGLMMDTELKGKMVLQSVLLIPWVIPETVTGYTWKWMMASNYGILNKILSDLHMIGPEFSWFRDGKMAMLAVILANVWRAFPFMAIMVFAKKKTMPADWIEAAKMDGANGFQILKYITFDYIKPVVLRVSTLIFIWSYNAFGIIYTMTDGGPLGATTIFPVYIQKKAFSSYDFGITAAMSVLMMLCMIVLLGAGSVVPQWIRGLLGLKTVEEEFG